MNNSEICQGIYYALNKARALNNIYIYIYSYTEDMKIETPKNDMQREKKLTQNNIQEPQDNYRRCNIGARGILQGKERSRCNI